MCVPAALVPAAQAMSSLLKLVPYRTGLCSTPVFIPVSCSQGTKWEDLLENGKQVLRYAIYLLGKFVSWPGKV